MPITVTERAESRRVAEGNSPSAELLYLVRGTGDEQAAIAAVEGQAPATYEGLLRRDVSVEPVGDGSDLWEGSVRYGRMSTSPKEVGESSFQFEIASGTARITQAKAHVATYVALGQVEGWHKGAINVTRDGRVEGCDIYVPTYTFSETHYKAADFVTPAYKAALFALVARTNSGAFKGFAAGEVLFCGASGSRRGDESWEITYRFAASPNATGLVVGSITGIAKKGWEYLWVEYEDVEWPDGSLLVQQPMAAHVERVYDAGDFAALGIGT